MIFQETFPMFKALEKKSKEMDKCCEFVHILILSASHLYKNTLNHLQFNELNMNKMITLMLCKLKILP